MGRRRKIFTKREYEKLQKTHQGRQKINRTYAISALLSSIGLIVIGIGGLFARELAILAIMGFIGAFFSIVTFIYFVVAYKNENEEEQERIKKANEEKRLQNERLLAQLEYERKMAQIKREEEQARLLKFKNSNMDEIDKMNGYQFETFISAILEDLGYRATTTQKSGDFGVDIIMEKGNEKIIIQTKRYAKKVSLNAVQEITSAKNYYEIQNAWVITNNYFTEPAQKLAKANNIKLVNRDELADMIVEAKNLREQQAKSA